MNTIYKHSDHFRDIAPQYNLLRTTNVEPVAYIAHHLRFTPDIHAADIGCGMGRYTSLLYQYLWDKAPLIHCVDYSVEMLKYLHLHFSEQGYDTASTVNGSAMQLPLKSGALNCVFSFNAIHHFDLSDFFNETARILQDGGYLFIYTRLRNQNRRNIWGRYFPLFHSKETRLLELDELEDTVNRTRRLHLTEIKNFQFKRNSTLEDLIYRAQNHHYSTFDLYAPDEFDLALGQFSNNLLDHFEDPHNIQWVDENVLLVIRKSTADEGSVKTNKNS
jgi:ubiquinone/menaquinone biosynthesis C-methylase UbiE